jgi:hypothetical protein
MRIKLISKSLPCPRYFLRHSETRKGEGKLLFQESGRYRVATHLELTFKLASDEELKDHLAAKLLAASTEIDQNRVTMRNMEHTLD